MARESTALGTFDFRNQATTVSTKVSFSRESEASYYGSDGFLHFSKKGLNLLSNSQSFTNSVWNKVAVTATVPSDVAAPDGTDTANKITQTTATSEHRVSRGFTVTKGAPITLSIFLKAGTATKIMFCLMTGESYTGGNPGLRFDLGTGTLLSKSSNVVDYEAINTGNGWWRIKLTAVADLGNASGMHLYLLSDGNSMKHTGSTEKYLYAWGAQFEQGPAMTAYAATTNDLFNGLRSNYDLSTSPPRMIGALVEGEATNLVLYSQLQSNTAWRKQYAAVIASSALSPDGTSNAFKIREDTARSTQHYIVPNPTIASVAGNTYTFSAFLKAAERKWAYFNLNGLTVHFDLINGVIGNKNDVFKSTAMRNVGNGWFRCSATFVVDVPTTSAKIGPEISNGQPAYSGDGNSGILIWGAQFEMNSFATSYIRTEATKGIRNADVVTLAKPSNDTHAILVQRANGGVWLTQNSSSYRVEASTNEVELVNFYKADETYLTKDETAQILFPEKFESAGLSNTKRMIFDKEYVIQTANKSHSLLMAVNKTAPFFRMQVNSGDVWSGDTGNSKKKERSEFYQKGGTCPYDSDVWLSYAIRIAPGDPINVKPAEHCYLGQFHATEDPLDGVAGPFLGFRFEGDNILRAYTCATTENPHRDNPPTVIRATATVDRGVWHRMVVRVRFSPTNGQFQWWQNGIELINVSGIGIGYPDKSGPYWKFGIYRSAITASLTVDYANMEISIDGSLLSRVTAPLLIA